MTPDKTAVMGLSMGGFGALHTALMFPETFGVCTALSSALIHNEVAKMKPGEGNPVANKSVTMPTTSIIASASVIPLSLKKVSTIRSILPRS